MKIHLNKALVLFLLLAFASPAMAATTPETATENREAQATQLKNRLEEIKAMDKTHLTRSEKKALRREVREIKKELAASGGVYLSIGAILLIALLLILLL
ncbi:MAG: hypothetical protein WD824_05320 [Cyclobacteriaceae bacterium]